MVYISVYILTFHPPPNFFCVAPGVRTRPDAGFDPVRNFPTHVGSCCCYHNTVFPLPTEQKIGHRYVEEGICFSPLKNSFHSHAEAV